MDERRTARDIRIRNRNRTEWSDERTVSGVATIQGRHSCVEYRAVFGVGCCFATGFQVQVGFKFDFRPGSALQRHCHRGFQTELSHRTSRRPSVRRIPYNTCIASEIGAGRPVNI